MMDIKLCACLDSCSTCKICHGTVLTKPVHLYQNIKDFQFHLLDNALHVIKRVLYNSSKTTEKTGVFDQAKTKSLRKTNEQMVCFARAIGRGKSCVDIFRECLNIPDALQHKA